MEETIYNDYIPSKEEIRALYRGIEDRPDDVDDMIWDGKIIEYFGYFFDDLYRIFKKEHYAPQTLDDANNYLMQNYYKLDQNNEIAGIYTKKVDGKVKSFIARINKNNFYRAYYMPIWINLSQKERAQIVKWHFDHKKDMLNCPKLKLRFIEHPYFVSSNQSLGMFMAYENCLYVNNDLLQDSSPFDLVTTIEHEFQHVNQENSATFIKKSKKSKNNLYEEIILAGFCTQNYPTTVALTNHEENALYLGYIMEQKAEIRSLKEYEKINRANQQFFGVCKKQEQDTKKHILNFKFRNGILTAKQLEKISDLSKKEISDYVIGQKIIKQSDYFSKLYLLWRLKTNQRAALYKEVDKIFKSTPKDGLGTKANELLGEIRKCEKIIDRLNKNYIDVLRNNGKHLPKSVFSELNLEEK